MYGKVISAYVAGIDGQIVEVEVDVSRGLPLFHIVGLPDSSIRESAERVRAAIKNSGFRFPPERVTVNLAPADMRKEGASFDLAIAAGILATSEQLPPDGLEETLIIGELALDGSLRPVAGVVSMAEMAKRQQFKRIILPRANLAEASLISGIELIPLERLGQIADWRSLAEASLANADRPLEAGHSPGTPEDYADVCGQHHAKRALMVAAAGMHNIVLIGPPGSGKTMLIRRFASILPSLTEAESLEVTKIFSVAGKLPDHARLVSDRPFRSPHHTISSGGLIGGGSVPKPGEISLAHRGVLFLDELPEFPRYVLEALRQPLEEKCVTISRAKATYRYPAHFLLAASMNPCPCGFLGSETSVQLCTCSPLKIRQYRARISGPLLDRIDLHVEVPRVDFQTVNQNADPLSTAEMRNKINVAIVRQQKRYEWHSIRFNSELTGRLLRQHCRLKPDTAELLQQSFESLGLSVRAHDRILKIARTVADLDDCDEICTAHMAEALQYRTLDKSS